MYTDVPPPPPPGQLFPLVGRRKRLLMSLTDAYAASRPGASEAEDHQIGASSCDGACEEDRD